MKPLAFSPAADNGPSGTPPTQPRPSAPSRNGCYDPEFRKGRGSAGGCGRGVCDAEKGPAACERQAKQDQTKSRSSPSMLIVVLRTIKMSPSSKSKMTLDPLCVAKVRACAKLDISKSRSRIVSILFWKSSEGKNAPLIRPSACFASTPAGTLARILQGAAG